jgi:uncharacterized protein YxeA
MTAFLILGIFTLFSAVHVFTQNNEDWKTALFLVLGGFTSIICALFTYKKISFDHFSQVITLKKQIIRYSEVHAFQIIQEDISHSENSYTSCELNIVLKDGKRVNLIDHGDLQEIQNDAKLLSKKLRVALWDTTIFPFQH